MTTAIVPAPALEVSVRPLREDELSDADRVMRQAFGTFLGLPDPLSFMGDADYVRTRWRANPAAAFAARSHSRFVGSNFATRWGSVGFFGPLSVHPDFWNQGVAARLMEPVLECFERWQIRHAGLFTFAGSEKHVALYQKFGFWPCFLTTIMAKPVSRPDDAVEALHYTKLAGPERQEMLVACRRLTHAVYAGLDVEHEIRAVADQGLGEVVLLQDAGELAGVAVCHQGPGSEAGSGACYVKFAAVRPDAGAARQFDRLLEACESLAAEHGQLRLVAGVNTARREACQRLLARGFRTSLQGVVMQRGDDSGYNRPGIYLIDDWR